MERYQCNPRPPQILKDLKSLQIHQFVDHDSDRHRQPVVNIPPPPPPQPSLNMYGRTIHTTGQRSYPPAPPPPSSHHVVPIGHNGIMAANMSSREGSLSSDSGEGAPLSPVLKCELCGLSNFSSTKALQEVSM